MKINKKMLIKIIFMLITMYVVISNIYVTKATTLGNMESQAKAFITKGQNQASKAGINAAEIAGNFVGIGQILTMVGAGVLVAVTTYMGIKYLTSGPEAQAKLKVQLIGIVVSGVVIFGAYSIWKLVVNIASKF